jgi:hypothetical protein
LPPSTLSIKVQLAIEKLLFCLQHTRQKKEGNTSSFATMQRCGRFCRVVFISTDNITVMKKRSGRFYVYKLLASAVFSDVNTALPWIASDFNILNGYENCRI